MEHRTAHMAKPDGQTLYAVEGIDKPAIACQPILSAGDVTGAVAFLGDAKEPTELQTSLITAAAQFLGRQIES